MSSSEIYLKICKRYVRVETSSKGKYTIILTTNLEEWMEAICMVYLGDIRSLAQQVGLIRNKKIKSNSKLGALKDCQ